MKTEGKVVTVKTETEYKKALAEARGPVALEFVAKDCHYCDEEKPRVEELVKKCGDLTVLRVDVDDIPKLADDFECDGTPTIFYAKKPEELTPEKATELEEVEALRRKIKCTR